MLGLFFLWGGTSVNFVDSLKGGTRGHCDFTPWTANLIASGPVATEDLGGQEHAAEEAAHRMGAHSQQQSKDSYHATVPFQGAPRGQEDAQRATTSHSAPLPRVLQILQNLLRGCLSKPQRSKLWK